MKGGAKISWNILSDMAHPSHRGEECVELPPIRWEIGIRLKQLHHLVRGYVLHKLGATGVRILRLTIKRNLLCVLVDERFRNESVLI